MRELFLKSLHLTDGTGASRVYDYSITIDEMDVGGYACESYGIRVASHDGTEAEAVNNVTCSIARIDELCELVVGSGVTPLTLRDVISDWL